MSLWKMPFEILVGIHVATGFVGMVAFWVPLFARKGGRTHVWAGRVVTYCAYVVTLSAVTASGGRILSYMVQGISVTAQPDVYEIALFLGYLGVVTFAFVRQAIRAVATRKTPEFLQTPFHAALAWASIAGSVTVIAFALGLWSAVSPLLLGLSPIGLIAGRNMLRLMYHPGEEHMGWLYSHLGSMLGGGIAFHTAFIVFGAPRLLAYELAGPVAVVPWILPTLVGIPAIIIWTRRYKRRFSAARAGRHARPPRKQSVA